MPKKKNVILGVSASIAIYRSCDILRQLKKSGLDVTVVMTREAEELVRPVVFRSLYQRDECVIIDGFSQGWVQLVTGIV